MPDGQLAVRRRHFLTILARYARAKMEAEGLTMGQLAEIIGASGRNWVFRILAHDEDPGASGGRVEDPLMRLIDWIGFGEQLVNAQSAHRNAFDTHWCDVRIAILRCADIPEPVRGHLWAMVQNWASTTQHFQGQLCSCGEAHYCESEVREMRAQVPMTATEIVKRRARK